jgi:hypothetical protein
VKNTVFKKKDGIVTRNIAGETILVPVYGDLADIQKIFSVDPVAGYIWEKIDGLRTCSEILDMITEEYDVDRNVAEKDLTEFLESLKSTRFIVQA